MDGQTTENSKELVSASKNQEVVSIPIHPTGIYTYKEAAALSKCSYATIWRVVINGKLKATSVGNQPRILGSKLLEWIEAGGETGRSKATM
jgi:excisionase family DNA binding protein